MAFTSFIPVNDANATLDISGDQNTIVLALGAGDAITSQTGDGNNEIILGGNGDSFTGTGFPGSSDDIAVGGTGVTVTVGGYNTVDIYGDQATVHLLDTFTADNQLSFGANVVNAHGTGSIVATGASSSFTFNGDTGSYDVQGGTAAKIILNGNNGSGILAGGEAVDHEAPGGASVHVANNTINGGTGGTGGGTLIGSMYGSNTLTAAAGSASNTFLAGEYAGTIEDDTASSGNDTLFGYLGDFTPSTDFKSPVPDTLLHAGHGNDTLIAGAGNTTVVFGNGFDVLRLFNNAANEVSGGNSVFVTGIAPGKAVVDLSGFGQSTDAILAASTKSANGGTILHLTDGTSVTFNRYALSAADIIRS